MPAGAPLTDVTRQGNLWRFRAFGARPFLYAANWAAGFQASDEQIPPGFERYLPVTAQLLASGRTYAQCYDDSEKLSRRIEDHERRVREYERWGKSRPEGSTPKVVIYVGDAGPRLAAEAAQLRQESTALDRRCSTVAAMEADDDFVAFMRSAQNA